MKYPSMPSQGISKQTLKYCNHSTITQIIHRGLLFLLLFSLVGLACEGGVDPNQQELDPDLGPIFLEPTLDMQVLPDQGDGQVSRILGSFGDPCESNLDCADNWCVSVGEENLCTYTCLGDECPTGWSCRAVSNNSQDVTLICVPQEERLCKACESDRDCPSGGCYDLDGEQVCGTSCEQDEECQDGYSCQEIGTDGRKLCSPVSGSCSCDANRSGDVRICESVNESGRCYGRQTCGGTDGWSTCNAQVPVAEVCNQIDDDCNGIADDLPGIGEACSQEAMLDGELRRCEGITLCVMGEEQPQCSANIPQAELCNFRDDDCDGTVDEGFEERDQSCAVGVGICRRYGVQVCNETPRPEEGSDEEWSPIICNISAGEPELEERCDGLDNDCDGRTDEDYPDLGEICTVGEGFCRQSSVTRCDPSGLGVICEVSEGQGEIERCDGADNDCDGTVDEDFVGLNDFCTVGEGICQRRGLQVCSADALSVNCSVSAAEPEVETCDNRDNDCDGTIDEGFEPRGEACISGVGQCQAVGVTRCDEQGQAVVCSANAGMPNEEICDQLDNDCDGEADEGFAGLGDPCMVGQGTCQAVGILSCTEDKQGVECSVEANPSAQELCDGLDNDCDGSVDEDYQNLASVCTVGEGLCRQSGVIRCTADGQSAACSVNALAPNEELCDGADNDCDGSIDESFPTLNQICEVGSGICQRRGLLVCDDQGQDIRCSVAVGEANQEICDDLDNDCDGQIDEGFAARAVPCTVGIGTCQAVGITRCDEQGTDVVCSAQANPPAVELCDNLDNDCDGNVDEDYPSLNELCSAGQGVCTNNGINRCGPDQQSVICSVSADEASEELCDNLDNDCDGEIDEGFIGINDFCTQGEGICQRRGLLGCSADGSEVICNVNAAEPEIETCDDLDNDCDGLIDEGFPARGEACVEGIGACETVGVTRCTADGLAVSCSAVAREANAEVCDRLDNDCDGSVDEAFPTLGEVCTEGTGFCRQSGVTRCMPNGEGTQCSVSALAPNEELCDGADNDCDGLIDESFPNLNELCEVGQGICQRRGLLVCDDQGQNTLCSVTAGEAAEEICDDLDNDCDGITDEGFAERAVPCTVGIGTCQAVGITRCDEQGTEVVCSAQANAPSAELCDNLDNDCDGSVDEDYPTLNELCSAGQGICTNNGINRCAPDQQSVICSASADQAGDELCDNLDNDCDGSIDEGFVGINDFCIQGAGICQRRGLLACSLDGTAVVCNVSAAEPEIEICDDLDNDCDGQIDEGYAARGEVCATGIGACEAVGVTRCTADGQSVSCTAVEGAPSAETCDSIDNDCDGTVDEDFPTLGVICTEGTGFCRRSSVTRCDSSGLGVVCEVSAGSGEAELCDGVDNDCDNAVDEDFVELNTACTVGTGICQRRGLKICADNGIELQCSVEAAAPEIELCDDLDNDCDGLTDEGYAARGEACIEGVGACQEVGVTRCSPAGDTVVCSAQAGVASAELCDGIDNDCDGSLDEGFAARGEPCSLGIGACQSVGVTRCSADGLSVACSAIEGQPSLELCDGLDNDCDASIDEEFAGKGEPCTDGIGACQNVGVNSCAPEGDRLICSASAGQPNAESCDSLDNDCDGVTDEDFAQLGAVCNVGIGLCRQSGVNRCSADGNGVSCSVEAGQAVAELCDGLDNDCDGSVDEDFPALNEICTEGIGACQRRGLQVCAADGQSLSCSVVAGAPEAELCDDLDNDCDGSLDETFPTKGAPCTQGIGICQAVGINRCSEAGDSVLCSAVENQASQEVCDGLDNDCDGSSDETHPLVNTQCTVGQGLCLRSGVYQCDPNDSSLPVACDAEQINGAANEACDYQDDDCDGLVDETYISNGKYLSLAHCGACNSDCTTLWDGGAAAYFITPVCRVLNNLAQCSYDCLPGHYDLDGLSNNGCEFSPDDTAIYVKPTQFGGQDVANCGSFNQACATLNYAVQIAQSVGKARLRVAEGVYRENFELPNGFEILGGHQQNSWVRSPEVSTSHIDARGLVSVEQHRYGVIARNIDQPTLLDGFLITADTPIQRGNSYGVYIIDSDENLVISNNRIVSGDGGRGRDGSLGANGFNGVQGQAGSNSFGISNPNCNGTNLNIGGLGGVNTCGGQAVSGGAGASSICPDFDQPAGVASAGLGASPGQPGVTAHGFQSTSSNSCSVGNGPRDAGTGTVGANGNDGQGAVGAVSAQGLVQSQHWTGIDGQNGSLAEAGSGGGGGGGAAGVVILYTNDDDYDIGATGGGGGSGACGGEGGGGGQSGGGSFGVFMTYSIAINNSNQLPIIQDNVITRGFGGSGGSGGPGGPGGRGGLPGLGGGAGNGLFQGFCSLQGGDGGKGGDGGNGGGGAGGQGGASYDFYLHNTSGQSLPYEILNISLVGDQVNTGGTGGVGGISANVNIGLGAVGLSGVSGLIYTE